MASRRNPAQVRRQALQALGAALMVLGLPRAAWAGVVRAVRVWPAAQYTRVTLESEAALAATHQRLSNPERLVIDISGLELSAELRELVAKVQPDDPFIAGVRVGQLQPRVVRLVLDLRQPVSAQVFSVPPAAAYRHRLVFDLHPAVEPDPLLQFLKEKLKEEGLGQRQVDDTLGAFIDRMSRAAPSSSGASGLPPAAAAGSERRTLPPASQEPAPHAQALQRLDRLIVVAIDPGHGGEDPGAIGPSGLKEKDVVLAIALRLRERINATAGMRAFLTRDSDYFVPLAERVRKARRVQADLFVSIHADAFFTARARGASVYALSTQGATSVAARWMAQRENASDSVGGINAKVADAQVLQAMLDMSTTAQINDSLRLGSSLLGQLDRIGRLHKPKVEQAGFAVLKAPDVPSVLVETAFISNHEEEARLASPDYQARLADALARGIELYFANNPAIARRRTL